MDSTNERLTAIESGYDLSGRLEYISPDDVHWLIAKVRQLTSDNKQLQENYEMAKRIIHSAGGICRETLP